MALSDTAQAELVKENKWMLLKRSDKVQVDDRVVLRYLPVMQEDLDTTLAKVKASATVTNPRVNQKLLSGVYVSFEVGWDYVALDPLNPRTGLQLAIVQELRKVADVTATGTGTSDEHRETRYEVMDGERHRGAAAALADVPFTAGAIVETENVKRDDGLFDTHKVTQTATAVSGAVAEKTITAFETMDTDADRHQTTAVAEEVSQTPGAIKTTRAEKDEFGRFTNTTETRTSTPVTDAEKSKEVRDDETIERAADRNQATGGTLPTSHTDGQIDAVTNRKNEFGKYDVETLKRTAQQQNITAYDHVKTRDYSATLAIYHNSSSAPTLGVGEFGEVRYELNTFGRYDGYKLVRTYAVDVGIYPPYTGLTEVHIQSRPKRGTSYDEYRTITSTFNVGYYQTQGAAYNAISGGLDGSGVYALARGVWMAKKVTNIVAAAWTETTDGAYTVSAT